MKSKKSKKPPHSVAQGKAKSRLVEMYRDQYVAMYREECAKLGLNNHHPTRAERITKLKEQLQELESAGV